MIKYVVSQVSWAGHPNVSEHFLSADNFEFRHHFYCGFLEALYFFNPGSFQRALFVLIRRFIRPSSPIFTRRFVQCILQRSIPVPAEELDLHQLTSWAQSTLRHSQADRFCAEIRLHLDFCECCQQLRTMSMEDFSFGLNVQDGVVREEFIASFREMIMHSPNLPIASAYGTMEKIRLLYSSFLTETCRTPAHPLPRFPPKDQITCATSRQFGMYNEETLAHLIKPNINAIIAFNKRVTAANDRVERKAGTVKKRKLRHLSLSDDEQVDEVITNPSTSRAGPSQPKRREVQKVSSSKRHHKSTKVRQDSSSSGESPSPPKVEKSNRLRTGLRGRNRIESSSSDTTDSGSQSHRQSQKSSEGNDRLLTNIHNFSLSDHGNDKDLMDDNEWSDKLPKTTPMEVSDDQPLICRNSPQSFSSLQTVLINSKNDSSQSTESIFSSPKTPPMKNSGKNGHSPSASNSSSSRSRSNQDKRVVTSETEEVLPEKSASVAPVESSPVSLEKSPPASPKKTPSASPKKNPPVSMAGVPGYGTVISHSEETKTEDTRLIKVPPLVNRSGDQWPVVKESSQTEIKKSVPVTSDIRITKDLGKSADAVSTPSIVPKTEPEEDEDDVVFIGAVSRSDKSNLIKEELFIESSEESAVEKVILPPVVNRRTDENNRHMQSAEEESKTELNGEREFSNCLRVRQETHNSPSVSTNVGESHPTGIKQERQEENNSVTPRAEIPSRIERDMKNEGQNFTSGTPSLQVDSSGRCNDVNQEKPSTSAPTITDYRTNALDHEELIIKEEFPVAPAEVDPKLALIDEKIYQECRVLAEKLDLGEPEPNGESPARSLKSPAKSPRRSPMIEVIEKPSTSTGIRGHGFHGYEHNHLNIPSDIDTDSDSEFSKPKKPPNVSLRVSGKGLSPLQSFQLQLEKMLKCVKATVQKNSGINVKNSRKGSHAAAESDVHDDTDANCSTPMRTAKKRGQETRNDDDADSDEVFNSTNSVDNEEIKRDDDNQVSKEFLDALYHDMKALYYQMNQ